MQQNQTLIITIIIIISLDTFMMIGGGLGYFISSKHASDGELFLILEEIYCEICGVFPYRSMTDIICRILRGSTFYAFYGSSLVL